MIFVIRQAFVDLSFGDVRKTSQDIVNGRAINNKAYNVVDADASAFDNGAALTDAGNRDQVSICGGSHGQTVPCGNQCGKYVLPRAPRLTPLTHRESNAVLTVE